MTVILHTPTGSAIAIEIGPRLDGNREIPARLRGHAITDASTQTVIAIRSARPARG